MIRPRGHMKLRERPTPAFVFAGFDVDDAFEQRRLGGAIEHDPVLALRRHCPSIFEEDVAVLYRGGCDGWGIGPVLMCLYPSLLNECGEVDQHTHTLCDKM